MVILKMHFHGFQPLLKCSRNWLQNRIALEGIPRRRSRISARSPPFDFRRLLCLGKRQSWFGPFFFFGTQYSQPTLIDLIVPGSVSHQGVSNDSNDNFSRSHVVFRGFFFLCQRFFETGAEPITLFSDERRLSGRSASKFPSTDLGNSERAKPV